MKNYVLLVFTFFCVLGVAQETCDADSFQVMVQKKLAKSKKIEKDSEEKFEASVDKLAKLKGWDNDKKLSYLLEMVSTDSFKKSTTAKFDEIRQVMELFGKADKVGATKNNCEILAKIEGKLDKVMKITAKEWALVMEQVEKDSQ